MKNIFLNILILSSNIIYSANTQISSNIKVIITEKEPLQHQPKQKKTFTSLDEDTMDFSIQELERENTLLKNNFGHGSSSNGWKIAKGLVGLWLGTKFFFTGSKGVLVALMVPGDISKMISSSSATLSATEKLLTNRYFWLSACSALTAFSAWLLKKSADNLYQGLCDTEDKIF